MKISDRIKYGCIIFDINGDISFNESKELEDIVLERISGKNTKVIMNIAELTYLNSTSLNTFVRIYKKLDKSGIKFYLMNVSEKIIELLNITGVMPFFKIIEDETILADEEKMKELDLLLDEETI